VPTGNLFKDRPIDGSARPLSNSSSQLPQQIIESPVVCMLLADPLESSSCNGIPLLRISQKISDALGEFIHLFEDYDFLTNAKILF
jgi:hypothetical protein